MTPLEAESERELAVTLLALELGWGVAYAKDAQGNFAPESSGVWLSFYCPACMLLGPSHEIEVRLGDRGPGVVTLRHALGMGMSELFDAELETIVKSWQAYNQIAIDGVVRLESWKKLSMHPEIAARCDWDGSTRP